MAKSIRNWNVAMDTWKLVEKSGEAPLIWNIGVYWGWVLHGFIVSDGTRKMADLKKQKELNIWPLQKKKNELVCACVFDLIKSSATSSMQRQRYFRTFSWTLCFFKSWLPGLQLPPPAGSCFWSIYLFVWLLVCWISKIPVRFEWNLIWAQQHHHVAISKHFLR